MSKKILAIGAGASYGARINFSSRPPLGDQLLPWLVSVSDKLLSQNALIGSFSTIEAGKNVLKKCDPNEKSFENFMKQLDKRDRQSIQLLLKISFNDFTRMRIKCDLDVGFKEQMDGYDSLIELLKINTEEWSVISLNYDLLFEQALKRKSIPFYSPQFPTVSGDPQTGNSGKIPIFKPHGCISFFAQGDYQTFNHQPEPGEYRGSGIDFDFNEDNSVTPNYTIAMASPLGPQNIISRSIINGIPKPVMANYMFGKTIDVNPRNIKKVRLMALEVAKSAEEVYVIGIRPIFDTDDDPFLGEFFNTSFKKITYVSGDSYTCLQVKEKYSDAKIFEKGILDFIENLRKPPSGGF